MKKMLLSVQFLRFVAAVGVVFHHAISYFDIKIYLGASGVDVFFVISGIVIGYTTKEKDNVFKFLLKRMVRVFPLYWIATFVYILFRYVEWSILPSAESVIRSLFLLPEYGISWCPIYYPGWTLSYEIFFYILYGAILVFAKNNVNFLCALVLCLISLIVIPVPWKPSASFETQICLEFVFGLMLSELLKRDVRISRGIGLLCLGVSLVMFALSYMSKGTPRSLSWGVPSLLLCIGFYSLEDKCFFKRKLIMLLGDSSYSIYLCHIIVMEFILEFIKRHFIEAPAISGFVSLYVPMLVFSAVVVGVFVHLVVEKPMLKFMRNLFNIERNSLPPKDMVPVVSVPGV